MILNVFCFVFQVCAALRKMTSVLRLGVYRERIEKYSGSGSCGRRSAEELRNHAYPEDSDESGLPPYSTLKAQPQQPQKGKIFPILFYFLVLYILFYAISEVDQTCRSTQTLFLPLKVNSRHILVGHFPRGREDLVYLCLLKCLLGMYIICKLLRWAK